MTELDARMAQLQARFRTRAAQDGARIAAARGHQDWAEVMRLAHGLSGSGGVFGFPEVSEAAAAVEAAIEEGRGAGAVSSTCDALLERLAQVAQRD